MRRPPRPPYSTSALSGARSVNRPLQSPLQSLCRIPIWLDGTHTDPLNLARSHSDANGRYTLFRHPAPGQQPRHKSRPVSEGTVYSSFCMSGISGIKGALARMRRRPLAPSQWREIRKLSPPVWSSFEPRSDTWLGLGPPPGTGRPSTSYTSRRMAVDRLSRTAIVSRILSSDSHA